MTESFPARVGPKGQAVIPKPLRDRLGIHPGDEVHFREEDGHLIVEKKDARQMWDELFAAFPKERLAADIDFDAIYEESYEE